jgi:hypothetical protein
LEVLMKTFPAFAVAAAALLSAPFASADETAPPVVTRQPAGIYRMPDQVIYGRPMRPMVVVDVRAMSPAAAAGEAHERLRTLLVNQSEPPSLRR